MRILVAIQSSKRAEEMAHTTLRWAARAGFNLRIFIPDKRQLKKYEAAVDDANYHYYFNIPPSVLVPKEKPMDFARREGFDLLVLLPDNLLDYDSVENDDQTFVQYATDVGRARAMMARDPDLMEVELKAGCKVVRVQ